MRVRGDYGVFVININFLMYHCTRENQNKYYFTQNKLTSSTPNRSVPIFSSNHHVLAGLSAVHLGGVNLTRWSYFYDISQGVVSAINNSLYQLYLQNYTKTLKNLLLLLILFVLILQNMTISKEYALKTTTQK
jgi:hypothetical protein